MPRKTRVREHTRLGKVKSMNSKITYPIKVREHERTIASDAREQHLSATQPRSDPIIIDMRDFQEADDGNTSHYGGEIVVNGDEKIRGYGSDRGDNSYEDLVDAVLRHAPQATRNAIRNSEFGVMDFESEVQQLTPGRRYKVRFVGTQLKIEEAF